MVNLCSFSVLQITVCVDVNKLTVKELEERVLKSLLNMVQPDAVKDSTGDVVISSEEGEMEGTYHKTLAEMGILDGTVLSVDDFVQNYALQVIINHRYFLFLSYVDYKYSTPNSSLYIDKPAVTEKLSTTNLILRF